MAYKLFFISLLLFPCLAHAQDYNENLSEWRQNYKLTLLRGNHPMKPADTSYLRYFEPDADYCVKAKFIPSRGVNTQILKAIYDGTPLKVTEYGYAEFELMGTSLRLHIYKVAKDKSGTYELFIPFTDPTNNLTTYRGGRYLNIDEKDITGNIVVIDFNKSYNPRSAYIRGYPDIIPPAANHLKLDINAGEKAYGIDPGY